MYFRAKLRDNGGWSQGQSEPWKPQHGPMVFLFVGEYSIVTGQRGDRERSNPNRDPYAKRPDKPAELEAMHREVSNIVLDMESLLLAKFRWGMRLFFGLWTPWVTVIIDQGRRSRSTRVELSCGLRARSS